MKQVIPTIDHVHVGAADATAARIVLFIGELLIIIIVGIPGERLDDAIVPSSTVVQTPPTGGPYGSLLVNGLWDHNGKTVTAFIAGLDCGDYVVSNGSITVITSQPYEEYEFSHRYKESWLFYIAAAGAVAIGLVDQGPPAPIWLTFTASGPQRIAAF